MAHIQTAEVFTLKPTGHLCAEHHTTDMPPNFYQAPYWAVELGDAGKTRIALTLPELEELWQLLNAGRRELVNYAQTQDVSLWDREPERRDIPA